MAQKRTKGQKAATRRAKERAAKRTKLPSALDLHFIALHEVAQSMRRAGFDEPTIQGFICDQRLPEWIAPRPDDVDFDDDGDDD